jgi:hypothetical protein
MKRATARKEQIDPPESPAVIGPDHVRDRNVSTNAGAAKAWSRHDGLRYLQRRRAIARHQYEAGTKLQDDYQVSLMQGGARSGGERSGGGRRSFDIPQIAIDADRRVDQALAILPPELLSMTVLFLLPHSSDDSFSLEQIAKVVREDKRSITLGVRAALSLLARHYGYCG